MALNTRIRGAQIVLSAEVIAVGADSIAFIDADGVMKSESVADLATAMAGDGLGATSGVFAVNVDDSSIETNADTLRVKALGITNDMLAGSITDAKLDSDYIQTSEVDDTTIEFDSGTLNVKANGLDNNELNAGAGSAGQVLTLGTGDALSWTDKSSVGEDYVQEAEIVLENLSADVDVTAYAGAHTLTDAPVTNSVQIFLNGLLQEEGSGKDYTLGGTGSKVVTFATQPISGDIIIAHYIKT